MMGSSDTQYFLKSGKYGFRLYDHERDEQAVCRLCWANALPGGRGFVLIPEAGAVSFGRIVTGPFAKYAPEYFYVADDLRTGNLVGYLTGAEGGPVKTKKRKMAWMDWRDKTAERIAEKEFGEISFKLSLPIYGFLEGAKFFYALSLGSRAIQFLLHAKFNGANEMPKAPPCPEFHFHVASGHRGEGIGRKFIEHFVSRFSAGKNQKVCAQVTVCEGHKDLDYYDSMKYRGKNVWKVFDRKETAMYTNTEKQQLGLGRVVENVSLVADRKKLLAFIRGGA